MGTVITLPRDLVSRSIARRTFAQQPVSDTDIVLDAAHVTRTSTAGIDELVKLLLAADVQRVITVNASPTLERALRVIHRARTRPERTFLLTFREIAAEALLRPV